MDTFDVKLLRRAIGQKRTHRSIKPLYSDHTWARDLDIVNELSGHTGCVNALNWSTGGNFLASGSDDTYLNIWEYNPANLAKPFTLNTSVSTGHHANIFSVKFMPHSNDRTVVTCAGDSEVRVFDLEYAGTVQTGSSDASNSTRSRRFNNAFGNSRWLNENNTNARVYRSHSERVKRIVTESSPHLFMTCSEDGEVRQWDLRQPSSSYPPPAGARSINFMRTALDDIDHTNVPPPLISYKRYGIDLNTITCSKSQPYYIALGGLHLHCFLHDRRMLGRDLSNEQGRPAGFPPRAGSPEDDTMREATRCVRRFAPNNKRRMQTASNDPRHITACKISDARPNELISSWSGDHVYSFDIVKSPDAKDSEARQEREFQEKRRRNRTHTKRGQVQSPNTRQRIGGLSTSVEGRTLQRVGDDVEEDGQTALRVRFQNGETEDISMNELEGDQAPASISARDRLLTEAQKQSERIAQSLVKLRKTLFDFSAVLTERSAESSRAELTPYTSQFTSTLGQSAGLLPEMEEIMRSWSYPMDPDDEEISYQNSLRRNRQASWRFVQAAGCLARATGGRLQTLSSAPDPRLAHFDMIRPAPREERHISPQNQFLYDFLKAILAWLNGGPEAVLSSFIKPAGLRGDSPRFPFSETDTVGNLPEKLGRYLLELADEEKPILDLGTNRFERDELRNLFDNQKSAVQAFVRAVASVELRDNQGLSSPQGDLSSHGDARRIMDKGAAVRYWGVSVGRSLLMDAGKGVTFASVQHAFGGLQLHIVSERDNLGHESHTIPDEDDYISSVTLLADNPETSRASVSADLTDEDTMDQSNQTSTRAPPARPTVFVEDEQDGENGSEDEPMALQDTEGNGDHDEDNDSIYEDSDSDSGGEYGGTGRLRRRGVPFGRMRVRAGVNLDVPYSSHSRVYKGLCNTRTVKDVNYYGPDDEYVVSGSDCGHFFIWDRKTSEVVNVLEGDGEVVNVVQGHPYEPMIACSGIDNSIKIFGPGGENRERYNASKGIDLANTGGSDNHSSIRTGRRQRRTRDESDDEANENDNDDVTNIQSINGTDRPSARNALRSRRAIDRSYEIMSQNEVERRRGVGDALLTEGMLAHFAARMQRGDLQGILGQGFGGTGGTVVLDNENCSVM